MPLSLDADRFVLPLVNDYLRRNKGKLPDTLVIPPGFDRDAWLEKPYGMTVVVDGKCKIPRVERRTK